MTWPEICKALVGRELRKEDVNYNLITAQTIEDAQVDDMRTDFVITTRSRNGFLYVYRFDKKTIYRLFHKESVVKQDENGNNYLLRILSRQRN